LIVFLADTKTGETLKHGSVIIQQFAPNPVTVVRRTDPEGRATFDAVASGQVKVTAGADGYALTTATIDLAETDSRRELRLTTQQAPTHRLQVTDSTGAPVAQASVIPSPGEVAMRTDAEGFCTVQFSTNGPARVFVIPRERSFGIIDVNPSENSVPARLTIPRGDARISIRVVAEDGTPVPNVGFSFRFNGSPIPPHVLNIIAAQQLRRLETDRWGLLTLNGMPAGIYEFWPATSEASAGKAPITLAAQPGTNFAEITVERQRAP
jgi:hypothetical protein